MGEPDVPVESLQGEGLKVPARMDGRVDSGYGVVVDPVDRGLKGGSD